MDKWDTIYDSRQRFCVGYLFSPDLTKVVLIRKNRPDWQATKLNGVGGKLQDGETPLRGMQREFLEETGLEHWEWKPLARLEFEKAVVWFFWGTSCLYDLVETKTDEPVEVYKVGLLGALNLVPNSCWLIPMAISFTKGERANCFVVHEVYDAV
jgi:8-oxo-dGTP diphosphatase